MIKRLKSPTPEFWRKVRNGMITLTAIGGALLTLPVSLPAGIITLAGYALAVGTIGSVLSQATKEDGTIDIDSMKIEDLVKLQEIISAKENILSEAENILLNKVKSKIQDYQSKYISN